MGLFLGGSFFFFLSCLSFFFFFFSSRRRHTRLFSDWSSDVCSSDLRFAGVGLRSAHDDPLLQELFGRLVESPCGDLLRGSVGDAHNDVGIPWTRARTVKFRRRRGMVRMAVVNPD